jgi:hypothetical protein
MRARIAENRAKGNPQMIEHYRGIFIRTTFHPNGEFWAWSAWKHVDSYIIFSSPNEYAAAQQALNAGKAWADERETLSAQVMQTLSNQDNKQ